MSRDLVSLYVRAVVWLVGLGLFFFASYNAANAYAAGLPEVPSIAFGWEHYVPFLAWSIVPYWSSDLLYALSFALHRTREQLDRHALRLLAIQLFSVCCFVMFPLRMTTDRPTVDGLPGLLFEALGSFDKPFNQAPSLHVSLAVILWVCYREVLKGWLRWLAAGWFLLVALSAWTSRQHHFIDLPTGLWAGILVVAAIPEKSFAARASVKLALGYLIATLALTAAAFYWQGLWWLTLWPAFSLSMVACAYRTGDPSWLFKRNGRVAFWMWPYMLAAWINSRLWTRGQAPWQHVADGVWIGRAPAPGNEFASVLDLTAELPVAARYHIPMLDLVVPTPEQVREAVKMVMVAERPLLVCCALGYSRSATVVAAWLVAAGLESSASTAIATLKRVRPQIVIGKEAAHCVETCANLGAHA